MKDCGRWTAQQRRASLYQTKKAIRNGEIPPAKELGCNRCGQTEGIIEYHNDNYDDPVKYLEPLCFRCHMIHHSFHINPTACAKYWMEIGQGKQYPPLFKRNFWALKNENGIKTRLITYSGLMLKI